LSLSLAPQALYLLPGRSYSGFTAVTPNGATISNQKQTNEGNFEQSINIFPFHRLPIDFCCNIRYNGLITQKKRFYP
jgi:hypothetical protein